MGNHVGAQVSAPRRKRPVEHAEHRDDEDQLPALIAVNQPENHGLAEDSHDDAAAEAVELLLQIAPALDFFAEPGDDANQNPKQNFCD